MPLLTASKSRLAQLFMLLLLVVNGSFVLNGCASEPLSNGQPYIINAYYYSECLSIGRCDPRFNEIMQAVEKTLQHAHKIKPGAAVDFPANKLRQAELFGLEICFLQPVQLPFAKDAAVKRLFIDLAVPNLFISTSSAEGGEPYRNVGAYRVADSDTLLESLEKFWWEAWGITHPLDPETIRQIYIEPYHPQRLQYRIECSDRQQIGLIIAAFNNSLFCQPPAASTPQTRMTILFETGLTIKIEDTGENDIFKVNYTFAPVPQVKYAASQELAALFLSYREQLAAMKNELEPPGPFAPRQVRPGDEYELYPSPSPVTMNPPPHRELAKIAGGIMAEVLERVGDWVRVKAGESEGWIPEWFLSDDTAEPVRKVNIEFKVLREDAEGRLYPGGPAVLMRLEAGRPVKPLKEWDGWYEVGVFAMQCPAIHTAWLPKSHIADMGDVQPTQGVLKKGSIAYNVYEFELILQAGEEHIAFDTLVNLGEKRDGFVRIDSVGGWTGWTLEKNISYDLDSMW